MKLSRILSIVMALMLVACTMTITAIADETEDTTLTFGVFSDIHKNEYPLKWVMNDLITMAEGKENIDGLALVGDIVYFQKDETPEGSYYNILDENANYQYFVEKDVVSFAMGNHEFPMDAVDTDVCALSKEIFTQETGQTPSSHKIIGGYHFITGEPANYTGVFSEEGEQYVMDEITKALEDGADKPIFVLIHHPIDGTLFGSGSTRHSDEFVEFLKSQPRVVVFSGHNHYSISNPRAIRQYPGGATFVYTASVNSGNKLNDPYSTERHDTSYPSQAYLMQVDSATNVVTLKRFYVTTDNTPTWVENGDWVLDIPKMVAESAKETVDTENVYKYTYEVRAENSTAPKFDEGDAITLNSVTTKDLSITFPEATAGAEGEDNMVGYYKVDIVNKATEETVVTAKYISDYFKQENRRTSFTRTYTDLAYDTDYTVSVTPVNMWYVEGTPITLDFATGGLPGGFGSIVGYDNTYYVASATLNETGDGLTIDTAKVFQLTAENNTRLAGLYAVSKDNTFATKDIVYVYGEHAIRNTFVRKWVADETNPVNNTTIGSTYVGQIKGSNWDKFYPGMFGGVGPWQTMSATYYDEEVSTTSSHMGAYHKNIYFYSRTWDEAIAEATTLAAGDEAKLATYLANLESFYGKYFKADSHAEFIDDAAKSAYATAKSGVVDVAITAIQNMCMKYAYTSDQIVPISEIHEFSYKLNVYRGYLSYKENVAGKIVLHILNKDGTVTKHSATTTAQAVTNAWKTRTIDFDTATWSTPLPSDGYLVGISIYPLAGMTDPDKLTTFGVTPDNCNSAKNTLMLRVRFNGAYSVDIPKVPKPTYLSIDANGKLTGKAEGTTYMYAPLTSEGLLNGKSLTYMSVAENTVFEKGLYAVKVLGLEGECTDSDPVVLFVSGTAAEQKDIGNLDDNGRVNAGTALKDLRFKNTNDWVDGSWTGDVATSIATQYWRSYYFVMAHSHMSSSYTVAIRNASNEAALLSAQTNAANVVKNINFKYSYEGKEVLPVGLLGQIGFYSEKNLGAYNIPSDSKAKVIIYVLKDDLTVGEYSTTVTHTLKSDTFVKASAFNLPDSGYIIGIEIYPYFDFDATKATISTDTNNNRWAFEFNPKNYILKTAQETPVLAVQTGANKGYAELTISNYSNYASGTKFAYSTNEGATWTEFTGATLKFSQANKYYWVKAVGDDTHFESEVAIPAYPSAAVIYKGASLVLDGKIGIRIYFDVDKSVLGYTMLKIKVNSVEVLAKNITTIDYEADGRTAYATFYVAAKDYDDTTINVSQLLVANKHIVPGTTKSVSIVNSIPTIKVSDYFSAFYAQVEAGNEACIAANGLVTSLEAYCKNADAYFKADASALDSVVADTDAIALIPNPSKTTTYEANAPIVHHSTSLILEDTVTIRHYFKINDESVLEGLTSDATGFSTENINVNESGTKFLYVDIPDIDAANLDTQYTVKLTTADNNEISLTYSALNYVKLTYQSTNAKLLNLVKALYNYSAEAEKYNK